MLLTIAAELTVLLEDVTMLVARLSSDALMTLAESTEP